MGNRQSEIDDLKNEIKNKEEAFRDFKEEILKEELKKAQKKAAEEEKNQANLSGKLEEAQNKIREIEKQKEKDRIKAKQLQEEREKAEKLKQQEDREEQKKKDKLLKDITILRQKANAVKPGDSIQFPEEDIPFPQRLNVGVFGGTGAGKTSLMNSLIFAVSGELTEEQRQQVAPPNFHGGHTVRRRKVKITENLTFIDNRGIGIEDISKEGFEQQLMNQIEGKSSFVQTVNWTGPQQANSGRENPDAKIYCTVLVFNALNQPNVEQVNKFVTCLFNWQGRFPLAVVTHVKVAGKPALENLRVTLNTLGIEDIYEVENVTLSNRQLDPKYQYILLQFLLRCMKDGDDIFELRYEMSRESGTN